MFTLTWMNLLIVAAVITLVLFILGKAFSILFKLLKLGIFVIVILVIVKVVMDMHLF